MQRCLNCIELVYDYRTNGGVKNLFSNGTQLCVQTELLKRNSLATIRIGPLPVHVNNGCYILYFFVNWFEINLGAFRKGIFFQIPGASKASNISRMQLHGNYEQRAI